MPCKKRYVRIRAKDVGRKRHHYIRIGILKIKGKRGGLTKMLGGLRLYKTKRKRR